MEAEIHLPRSAELGFDLKIKFVKICGFGKDFYDIILSWKFERVLFEGLFLFCADVKSRRLRLAGTSRMWACAHVRETLKSRKRGDMLSKVNTLKGLYPKLKKKQRAVAEALCDPDDTRNVTELCQDFEISRTTFYNWQHDSEFMGYVNCLIENYTSSIVPKAWKEIGKKIDQGNMEAIRLLLEVKGKLQKESAISNNVVIFTGEDEILK